MSFPYGPIQTRAVLQPIYEGQRDWPVAVLQLNLLQMDYPLMVDGVFGPRTRAAVEMAQTRLHLAVDGRVGPQTSRAIALWLMWPAQGTYKTPPGLGRGILLGESGGDLACVSAINANGTRDVGSWQYSTKDYGDDRVLRALFDARRAASRALGDLRTVYDRYALWGCGTHTAWKLATLYHNRPADAEKLARASVGDDDVIDWSVIPNTPGWFTIGGVSYSNREWDQKYVGDKCKYARLGG